VKRVRCGASYRSSALRRLVQIPRQAPIAVAYAIGTLPSLWFFERLGGVLF
jgi:hypothetical protein